MGGKTVDMTKGSILPKMIRFALPVLLGMLFQRIYNFVDVYIVGRYLGDEALARAQYRRWGYVSAVFDYDGPDNRSKRGGFPVLWWRG